MTDLFDNAKPDPRIHPCATCGRPDAPCGIGNTWFCVEHVPASYWPEKRKVAG